MRAFCGVDGARDLHGLGALDVLAPGLRRIGGPVDERRVERAEVEQRDLLGRQGDLEVLAQDAEEDLVAHAREVHLQAGCPRPAGCVSMEALSGGSTGPSPDISRGPFSSAAGPDAGVGEGDVPGRLEADAERLEPREGVGAPLEQLGRGEALGEVLAAAAAASATGGQAERDREGEADPDERAEWAHHVGGIAWRGMCGGA